MEKAVQFDLDAVDTKTRADEGVFFSLRKYGSEELLVSRNGAPVRIKVLGPDSDVYRAHSRAQVQKRLRRAAPGKTNEIELEEADADALELLVAVTVDWENLLDKDGNAVPMSREAARHLYTGYPVIREQIEAFVVDRSRFLKASSET